MNLLLKGLCHEIIDLCFLQSEDPTCFPDSSIKTFLTLVLNSVKVLKFQAQSAVCPPILRFAHQ
jgi:hypothetical protein